jgi:hypothetical protein
MPRSLTVHIPWFQCQINDFFLHAATYFGLYTSIDTLLHRGLRKKRQVMAVPSVQIGSQIHICNCMRVSAVAPSDTYVPTFELHAPLLERTNLLDDRVSS